MAAGSSARILHSAAGKLSCQSRGRAMNASLLKLEFLQLGGGWLSREARRRSFEEPVFQRIDELLDHTVDYHYVSLCRIHHTESERGRSVHSSIPSHWNIHRNRTPSVLVKNLAQVFEVGEKQLRRPDNQKMPLRGR